MTKLDFDEPSEIEFPFNNFLLQIRNTGGGRGILGAATKEGVGLKGETDIGFGIWGVSKTEKTDQLAGHLCVGVRGDAAARGTGVHGVSGDGGRGVQGWTTQDGVGVLGQTDIGWGVWGQSKTVKTDQLAGHLCVGVRGDAASHGTGVHGVSGDGGKGVIGEATQDGVGVFGQTDTGFGLWGRVSEKGTNTKKGIGVVGEGSVAGRFIGDVEVTGDIKLVNADCAEDFDIVEENVEAGTVMVLTENGTLQSSYQEYDKKVAGIVSGASGYKPAIVLDRQEQKNNDRLPIALMGKVYCKVDARHSSIEIGDLLTTSSTKGYAMKAQDPVKAFGAVIGKALGSIKEGIGMIPVLVALQ